MPSALNDSRINIVCNCERKRVRYASTIKVYMANMYSNTEMNSSNGENEMPTATSMGPDKIIGTINHHVENLTYNNYHGGIENWDEVTVTGIMNDYLVGTKLTADSRRNRI